MLGLSYRIVSQNKKKRVNAHDTRDSDIWVP